MERVPGLRHIIRRLTPTGRYQSCGPGPAIVHCQTKWIGPLEPIIEDCQAAS